MYVCVGCGGPAVRVDGTVCCSDPECGMVRILPALPERLPWESD